MFFLFPELNSIQNITMLKKLPNHFKLVKLLSEKLGREILSIGKIWCTIYNLFYCLFTFRHFKNFKQKLEFCVMIILKWNIIVFFLLHCQFKPFFFRYMYIVRLHNGYSKILEALDTKLEKVLMCLHSWFKHSTGRREDYVKVVKLFVEILLSNFQVELSQRAGLSPLPPYSS